MSHDQDQRRANWFFARLVASAIALTLALIGLFLALDHEATTQTAAYRADCERAVRADNLPDLNERVFRCQRGSVP